MTVTVTPAETTSRAPATTAPAVTEPKGTAPAVTKTTTRTPVIPKSGQNIPAVIALFGGTGTGKSTFVNDASGSKLVVGDALQSCTQVVALGNIFQVDGQDVVLVDTPGFDDTNVSDTEILQRIAAFLTESYQVGVKLTGILFLHRITDTRVGGASLRNLRLFRQLCGTETLENVVLVTNMWSTPPTALELSRESQLREEDAFFKPLLIKGAKMMRRPQAGRESAHAIIRTLLNKEPKALAIQTEIVDHGKDLTETAAGKVLEEQIRAAVKKYQDEVEAVKKEIAELSAASKQEREELEETLRKNQQAAASSEKNLKDLESGFQHQREEWQKQVKEAQERQQQAYAQAVSSRRELEELRQKEKEQYDSALANQKEELEKTQKRIEELEEKEKNRRDGPCVIA